MAGKNSIAKNYIYNLLYQILVLIVPLFTTPYLSRVLGAEKIGIYSYTLSIVTYFVLFGTLGVAMYGQREIAYVQEKINERSKVFFEILIMRFMTLSFSLIIFYMGFCIHGDYNSYYKILVLEIISNSLDISWFFQGLEEFRRTIKRNVIVKIISVICIFIFIKTQEDLSKYFLIYVLSNLIGNISLWLYLPQYIKKVKLNMAGILRHLKPTIALFIPQIAVQIYTVLDRTMLGIIISDKSEVGIYEQSQKIIKVPLTLVTALGTVMSPRIANTMANNKKEEVEKYLSNSIRFVWFLGIPIMFGTMAIAKSLVPWFLGQEFYDAILVVIVGAPIIMAIGLNNITGVQYLVATKKQNIFTKSVLIGAMFNFIINMLLIHSLKAVGAIIASVLAEFLILFIQLKNIKKEIKLKIIYKDIGKYLFSGIIMFVVIFGMSYALESKIITTIVQVVIGIIIYITMLIIFKDKMLFQFFYKIKDKVIKNGQKS